MWATMERVSYLHSTDDGPKVRNRSTIWLKSSNQCRSCVDRVPIQDWTHFSELAGFNVFITCPTSEKLALLRHNLYTSLSKLLPKSWVFHEEIPMRQTGLRTWPCSSKLYDHCWQIPPRWPQRHDQCRPSAARLWPRHGSSFQDPEQNRTIWRYAMVLTSKITILFFK